MAGAALAGLAQGLAQGMQLGSNLQDAQERRAYMKKKSEQDDTKFGWENSDQEEKTRRRDLLKEGEKDYADADGILLPQQTAQPVAQTGIAPPPGNPAAQQMPPAPGGIAAPGAAPAAAPVQSKAANPYMTGLENDPDKDKKMDTYYERKSSALRKIYIAQGQYDKAEEVPKMMRQLRADNWSEKVGTAMASMAGGAPGAREAFAKVYGMVNDGWDLDPASGKFDAKTGAWAGLVRTKDGKKESFNLDAVGAMSIASKYKDPGEVVKFVIDRQDKDKDFKIKQQTADAHTTSAGASVMSAKAAQTRADADKTYANTLQGARAENEAMTTFNTTFGVREFQVKTSDEVKALMPDEKKAYETARGQSQLARIKANAASTLWNANDRAISPSIAAGAVEEILRRRAEGKREDGIDEKTKMPYINWVGKRVLVPKE